MATKKTRIPFDPSAMQAHAGDAPPDDDTTVLALARA